MPQSRRPLRIGLIADTHGLLRPEALERLRGCDQLIHAGDIGKPEILAELERLLLKIGRLTLYVLHDLKRLDLDPAAEGIDVVVAGHSHKPLKEERDGVLYLNPGSAGPRRFSLPIGIGVLEVAGKKIEAELITL